MTDIIDGKIIKRCVLCNKNTKVKSIKNIICYWCGERTLS